MTAQIENRNMKRRTMRNWFIFIFIIGLALGWMLPKNFWDFKRDAMQKPLQAGIYDIPKRMGQLDQETPYYKYMLLGETLTGSAELLRVDDKVPLHAHETENHFVFIYKGKAKVTIGSVTEEVGPGALVAIPAKVPHSLERIGDAPVEIILFSTPPFMSGSTLFLNQTGQ